MVSHYIKQNKWDQFYTEMKGLDLCLLSFPTHRLPSSDLHQIEVSVLIVQSLLRSPGALLNTGSNVSSLYLHSRPRKILPLSCCSTEHSLSPNNPQHSWHLAFVHAAPQSGMPYTPPSLCQFPKLYPPSSSNQVPLPPRNIVWLITLGDSSYTLIHFNTFLHLTLCKWCCFAFVAVSILSHQDSRKPGLLDYPYLGGPVKYPVHRGCWISSCLWNSFFIFVPFP